MLVKMVNSHWDLHKLLIVDVRQVLSDREATRLNRGTARRPAVRQQIMQQVYAERLLTAACEDLREQRVLCVGCKSGHHRAPTIAMECSRRLRGEGLDVEEFHLGLLNMEQHWANDEDRIYTLTKIAGRMRRAGQEVNCGVGSAAIEHVAKTATLLSQLSHHHQNRAAPARSSHDALAISVGLPGKPHRAHVPYASQQSKADMYRAHFAEEPKHPWENICHRFWRGSCSHEGERCWHGEHIAPPAALQS